MQNLCLFVSYQDCCYPENNPVNGNVCINDIIKSPAFFTKEQAIRKVSLCYKTMTRNRLNRNHYYQAFNSGFDTCNLLHIRV